MTVKDTELFTYDVEVLRRRKQRCWESFLEWPSSAPVIQATFIYASAIYSRVPNRQSTRQQRTLQSRAGCLLVYRL